jgi:protein required for attachment to host cells
MTQTDDTWVVVADAGRTRIFRTDAELSSFEPVSAHDDAPHGPAGAGGHGDRRDPHDRAEHAAAKALAHELDQAHGQRRYRDLVIVASPSFLGMVRGELSTATARSVSATLHHDYTGRQPAEIRDLVKKALEAKPLPR